ncbi:hypothetical protein PV08_00348 [Exophiala spinifera]|uniref:Mob1/phocein n=1 Tax=Exophiala spinifera TaxID=91928 RepID=A0A0D2C871_9EURO|nr:uncharacterized protein PV08_00348 [Exophiala spinifera]KIW19774.1 hypothetical protein PV08_00348 [Exophiala spinifera]
MTAVSPSSSPRLPSPPPIPEVQFGPKSPGIGDSSNELSLDAVSKPDEGAARRVRPGTRAADMARGPPLVPLNQLDSPFQLQEHLKALYSNLTHTPDASHTIPISKETALQLATPPRLNDNETVDRNLWLYELCRFLTMKANLVSISLMNDNPPCSAQTCPEMRASEWQYLCAVHEPPKSCCAIDYCNHTLDWAANVLTSPKHFPSRLALGGETGSAIQSMRQLTNIFRRVYRIFAHAWFQHREVFWSVEASYGLYMFFKTVCDEYRLIPEDSYTIPAEAEGSSEDSNDQSASSASAPEAGSRMQILRKDNQNPSAENNGPPSTSNAAAATTTTATGATTRRHKHTPSTGSHVAIIPEGQEEEEESTSSNVTTTLAPKADAESTTAAATERKDRSPERVLPKLDIGATLPKYEPGAPEDPTPTGTGDDSDPLAAAGGQATVPEDNTTSTQLETPVKQKSTVDEDEEEQVTSPSGGSIRTGGPDVLKAILGHLDDEHTELPSPILRAQQARMTSPAESQHSPLTSPSPSPLHDSKVRVEIAEKPDDDDHDDDDDDNEPESVQRSKTAELIETEPGQEKNE